jgi:hypothetical protein
MSKTDFHFVELPHKNFVARGGSRTPHLFYLKNCVPNITVHPFHSQCYCEFVFYTSAGEIQISHQQDGINSHRHPTQPVSNFTPLEIEGGRQKTRGARRRNNFPQRRLVHFLIRSWFQSKYSLSLFLFATKSSRSSLPLIAHPCFFFLSKTVPRLCCSSYCLTSCSCVLLRAGQYLLYSMLNSPLPWVDERSSVE